MAGDVDRATDSADRRAVSAGGSHSVRHCATVTATLTARYVSMRVRVHLCLSLYLLLTSTAWRQTLSSGR